MRARHVPSEGERDDRRATHGRPTAAPAARPADDPTIRRPRQGLAAVRRDHAGDRRRAEPVYGIAAIDNSTFYVRDVEFVLADLKTWGWVLLVIGIGQLAAAFGVWRRRNGAAGSGSCSRRSTCRPVPRPAGPPGVGADGLLRRHHHRLRPPDLRRPRPLLARRLTSRQTTPAAGTFRFGAVFVLTLSSGRLPDPGAGRRLGARARARAGVRRAGRRRRDVAGERAPCAGRAASPAAAARSPCWSWSPSGRCPTGSCSCSRHDDEPGDPARARRRPVAADPAPRRDAPGRRGRADDLRAARGSCSRGSIGFAAPSTTRRSSTNGTTER